jgi:hypothetical protein
MSTRHNKAVEQTFQKAAEHCIEMAERYDNNSDEHESLSGLGKIFGDGLKACQKAAVAESLEKTRQEREAAVVTHPEGLSRVAPEVRAVPRTGQRELPAKPTVPVQFAKLVQDVDEEMAESDAMSGLA